MFEKLQKTLGVKWFRVGNIILAILFVLSFAWFLRFSLRLFNQSLTAVSAPSDALEFNIEAFEKIKVLFDREGRGFPESKE